MHTDNHRSNTGFDLHIIKHPEIERVIAILQKDIPLAEIIREISFFHGPVIPRLSDCMRAMLTRLPR